MKKLRKRKLKIWNGRWLEDSKNKHIFICAYSVADAILLISEYKGYEPRGMLSEIRTYFSAGCWGNAMNGITQERGLWIQDGHTAPVVRVK